MPERLASCRLLEWDSEHFGFPIGRVTAKVLTAEAASAIDDWCLDHGVRCLYFLADADDAVSGRVAASHGFHVVDIRVTVRRSMEGVEQLPVNGPETMTIREASQGDLRGLRRLAARSHHGSRFYFDGGFPRERCDALYEAWVERCVRDPDRRLLLAMVDGELAGYMGFALPEAEHEGLGELGAVDERHRRKGIASALHVSMFRRIAERGAVAHRCPLSLRNLGVIRLHERLCFATEKVEIWHHKWYA